MARVAVAVALTASALAAAWVTASALQSGPDGRARASGSDGRAPAFGSDGRAPAFGSDGRAWALAGQGTTEPAVYPALRTLPELGLPRGRGVDTGVGVYPVLSRTSALAFPSAAAVAAARDYAATRQGRVAFAVADERGGVAGQAVDRAYPSASVVKAMILVAYLDGAERGEQQLSESDALRLDSMVRISDNASATTMFRRLGTAAVAALARRGGMRSFAVGPVWGDARVNAGDLVRFFLAIDRLVPGARQRGFARYLLSHVTPLQSWGIPQAARPGWRVYFKGGWRPEDGGELVHQAALLERGSRQLAIAVLSDRNPSQAYGQETIRGIAERLLGPPAGVPAVPRPAPGELVPVSRLRGFRAPEPKRLRPLSS